ncbi:hypothetical protein ACJJTC_010266 [Scirpophaga incertulas]
MKKSRLLVLIFCVLFNVDGSLQNFIVTTDELENHISPEDLIEFMNIPNNWNTAKPELEDRFGDEDETSNKTVPDVVGCFGLGPLTNQLRWIFDMKPDSSDKVNTHFYFSSQQQKVRVQVYPGKQFGLEWVDFKPSRPTVVIVHGFMSHSNSSWVHDMTRAFLQWGDVNVIAVDWSAGGRTWKYWKAVANTRRVGSDITNFLRQLKLATGARFKNFHFIGHSLGAHISSYASYHLGGVGRITGLDPAQPCFNTADRTERLDESDADFVDIIHTNGRLLTKMGLGVPHTIGHADFYPNGGMQQPGCHESSSLWYQMLPTKLQLLQQAVCSHGRSYLLFTESLLNKNCSFRAHSWNLTYEGVNSSLVAACDRRSCSGDGHLRGGGRWPQQGCWAVLCAHHRPNAILPFGSSKASSRSRITSRPFERVPSELYGGEEDDHGGRVRRPTGRSKPIRNVRCDIYHHTEGLFWSLILAVSAGCLYLILAHVGSTELVNFTPDTRYLTWQSNFPAVTICEMFFFRTALKKFATLYPNIMDPLPYEYRKYLTELAYGQGTCSKTFCVPCGTTVSCNVYWREVIEKVSVHSPEELATNELDYTFKFDVKPVSDKSVEYLFSMVEIENDPVLRYESKEVRGCRYLDEIPPGLLHVYPVYSYGACQLAQETQRLYEECGCIHPVRDPLCKF